jgi:hypothetical protein
VATVIRCERFGRFSELDDRFCIIISIVFETVR